MTFTGNVSQNFDAVQITATNIQEIADRYKDYTVHNGKLIDSKGAEVPVGTWIAVFADGTTKMFTDSFFKLLFTKVEPPTYKLSDIPNMGALPIRRKAWPDDTKIKYVENTVWIINVNNSAQGIYTFAPEDISADDWVIAD